MPRSFRLVLTSFVLGVSFLSCQCGPGNTVPDASVADAGVSGDDAGRDAGRVDAGPDAGPVFDAGRVDAGVVVSCAALACAPWETCVDGVAGGRCIGGGSIGWVSPIAGAVAPIDLISVPLAIDTSLRRQPQRRRRTRRS